MLDNLRDQAASSPFLQDEEPVLPEPEQKPRYTPAGRRSKRVFGLTPIQRLAMSVMFLLVVCLLGSMLLIVTEKFWIY